MALTHEKVVELARQAQSLADHLKSFNTLAAEFLTSNSNLAVDWNAAQKPAYIREDAAGNIDGGGSIQFSRAQVANVINSFLQVRNLLNNQEVSTGDHIGNVNQVAATSVTVRR